MGKAEAMVPSLCTNTMVSLQGKVKANSDKYLEAQHDYMPKLHPPAHLKRFKENGISVSYITIFFNSFQVPKAKRKYLLLLKNLNRV